MAVVEYVVVVVDNVEIDVTQLLLLLITEKQN